MTAIKPIENRRVRGVESARYPLGVQTSHPENDAEGTEAHHCFPRSQQIGDSWFVEITFDSKKEAEAQAELHRVKAVKTGHPGGWGIVIPHVVNLTMEEHTRVEVHDAKIALEDGVWVWYDRDTTEGVNKGDERRAAEEGWIKLGALNPQPGSREGKPKKKRAVKTGTAKRERENWQIRVPKDERENGAGILDEYIEVTRELLIEMEAPGVDVDSPAYQIVVPLFHAGMVALDAENKARKKAAKEERARKRAEKKAAAAA